jgi:3-phenylpropionate/trans-cinnamate dioxygenase ferredoxin subunit
VSTRLCRLADVADGAAVRIELAEFDVAVIRVRDEVFALEDVCSHAEFPLTDGEVENVDGPTIECALHGSRFDLRTGKPLGPPATQPVRTFPVAVDNGDVYIDLETESA